MATEDDGAGGYERRALARRLFVDRADAGTKLATALAAYGRSQPLVLGIARGGVAVAYQIAKRLDAELDVIVARKIAAPQQPELAIGAVVADGSSFTNRELRACSGLSDIALAQLTAAEGAQAHAREQRFRAGLPPVQTAGRVVILVDDGLATGATMRAALLSLRRAGAEHVVAAVPVGSKQACASVARDVDALVCLLQPEPFHAIGEHYEHFEQCTDDEVQRLLINSDAVMRRILLLKAEREYELLSLDAPAKYASFAARYPGIETRVAARHVASYLGITAVHLSRLRRQRRQRSAAL